MSKLRKTGINKGSKSHSQCLFPVNTSHVNSASNRGSFIEQYFVNFRLKFLCLARKCQHCRSGPGFPFWQNLSTNHSPKELIYVEIYDMILQKETKEFPLFFFFSGRIISGQITKFQSYKIFLLDEPGVNISLNSELAASLQKINPTHCTTPNCLTKQISFPDNILLHLLIFPIIHP